MGFLLLGMLMMVLLMVMLDVFFHRNGAGSRNLQVLHGMILPRSGLAFADFISLAFIGHLTGRVLASLTRVLLSIQKGELGILCAPAG